MITFAAMDFVASKDTVRYDGGRALWIDILRGLGILLVIADHCCIMYIPVFEYMEIPLFFLISGVLMAGGRDVGFKDFMLGKSKQLIVPYLLWAFIYAVIYKHDAMLEFQWRQVWRDVIVWPANAPLWFLKALWWAFLIVGGLRACGCFRGWKRSIFTIVVLMVAATGVALCNPDIRIILSGLPQGIIAASLLAIGMLLYRSGGIGAVMRVARSRRWMLPVAIGVLFMAVATMIHPERMIVNVDYAKMGEPVWVFYPFAVASCVAMFLIVSPVKREYVLAFFGRNSMVIFCSHYIFLHALEFSGFPRGWIMVVPVAAMSALTAVLYNRIKRWI